MTVRFIGELSRVNDQVNHFLEYPAASFNALNPTETCQPSQYLNKTQNNIKCLFTSKRMHKLSKD